MSHDERTPAPRSQSKSADPRRESSPNREPSHPIVPRAFKGNRALFVGSPSKIKDASTSLALTRDAFTVHPSHASPFRQPKSNSPQRVLLSDKIQGRAVVVLDGTYESEQLAKDLRASIQPQGANQTVVKRIRRSPQSSHSSNQNSSEMHTSNAEVRTVTLSSTETEMGITAQKQRDDKKRSSSSPQTKADCSSLVQNIQEPMRVRDAFSFDEPLSMSPPSHLGLNSTSLDNKPISTAGSESKVEEDPAVEPIIPPLARAAAAKLAAIKGSAFSNEIMSSAEDDLMSEAAKMVTVASKSPSGEDDMDDATRDMSPAIGSAKVPQSANTGFASPKPRHVPDRFTPPPQPHQPVGSAIRGSPFQQGDSEASLRMRRKAQELDSLLSLISPAGESSKQKERFSESLEADIVSIKTEKRRPTEFLSAGVITSIQKDEMPLKRSFASRKSVLESGAESPHSATPQKRANTKRLRGSEEREAIVEGKLTQQMEAKQQDSAKDRISKSISSPKAADLASRIIPKEQPLSSSRKKQSKQSELFEEESHVPPFTPSAQIDAKNTLKDREQSLTSVKRRQRQDLTKDQPSARESQDSDTVRVRLIFDEALAEATEHSDRSEARAANESDLNEVGKDKPRWERRREELKQSQVTHDHQEATSSPQVTLLRQADSTAQFGSSQLQHDLEIAEEFIFTEGKMGDISDPLLQKLLSAGDWVYPGLFPIIDKVESLPYPSHTQFEALRNVDAECLKIGYRLSTSDLSTAVQPRRSPAALQEGRQGDSLFSFVADTSDYFMEKGNAKAHAYALGILAMRHQRHRGKTSFIDELEPLSIEDHRRRRETALLLIKTASAPPSIRLASLVRVVSAETRRLHAALESYILAQSRAQLHSLQPHQLESDDSISLTSTSGHATHALRRIVFGFKSVLFPELASNLFSPQNNPVPPVEKSSDDCQSISIIEDSGCANFVEGYERSQHPLRFQILRVLTDDAFSNDGNFTLCLASVQQYSFIRHELEAVEESRVGQSKMSDGGEQLALTVPRICQLMIPNALGVSIAQSQIAANASDSQNNVFMPGDVVSVFWPWYAIASPFLEVDYSESGNNSRIKSQESRSIYPLQVITSVLFARHDLAANQPVRLHNSLKASLFNPTTESAQSAVSAGTFAMREVSKFFEKLKLRSQISHFEESSESGTKMVEDNEESVTQEDFSHWGEEHQFPEARLSSLVVTPQSLVDCSDPCRSPFLSAASINTCTIKGLLLKATVRKGRATLYLYQPPDITFSSRNDMLNRSNPNDPHHNRWSQTWMALASLYHQYPNLLHNRASQRRLWLSSEDAPNSSLISVTVPFTLFTSQGGDDNSEDQTVYSFDKIRSVISGGEGQWVSIVLRAKNGDPLSAIKVAKDTRLGRTESRELQDYDMSEDKLSSKTGIVHIPEDLASRLVHLGLAMTVYRDIDSDSLLNTFPEIKNPRGFPYATRAIQISSTPSASIHIERSPSSFNVGMFSKSLANLTGYAATLDIIHGKIPQMRSRLSLNGRIHAIVLSSIDSELDAHVLRPSLLVETPSCRRLVRVQVADSTLDEIISSLILSNARVLKDILENSHDMETHMIEIAPQRDSAKAVSRTSNRMQLSSLPKIFFRDVRADGDGALVLDYHSDILFAVQRSARLVQDQKSNHNQSPTQISLPFVMGLKVVGGKDHASDIVLLQTILAAKKIEETFQSPDQRTSANKYETDVKNLEVFSSAPSGTQTSSHQIQVSESESGSNEATVMRMLEKSQNLGHLTLLWFRENSGAESQWLALFDKVQNSESKVHWPWVVSNQKDRHLANAGSRDVSVLCIAPVESQPEFIFSALCSACGRDALRGSDSTAESSARGLGEPEASSHARFLKDELLESRQSDNSHRLRSKDTSNHTEILGFDLDDGSQGCESLFEELETEDRVSQTSTFLSEIHTNILERMILLSKAEKCKCCKESIRGPESLHLQRSLKVILRCDLPKRVVGVPDFVPVTSILENEVLDHVLLSGLLRAQEEVEEVQATSLRSNACLGVYKALISMHKFTRVVKSESRVSNIKCLLPSACLYLQRKSEPSSKEQTSMQPRFSTSDTISLSILPVTPAAQMKRLHPLLLLKQETGSNAMLQSDSNETEESWVSAWPDLDVKIQALEELLCGLNLTNPLIAASLRLIAMPTLCCKQANKASFASSCEESEDKGFGAFCGLESEELHLLSALLRVNPDKTQKKLADCRSDTPSQIDIDTLPRLSLSFVHWSTGDKLIVD